MISYFPKAREDVKKSIQNNIRIERTGDLGFEGYWPHLKGDSKIAAEGLKKVIKELAESPFMDKAAREKEIASAIYNYRQITKRYSTKNNTQSRRYKRIYRQ
jgi:hypothetical protein